MAWFSRAKAPRFPNDMLRRLELLGRFGLDPQGSGIDGGEVSSTCIIPFWPDATNDADGFLTDLHAVIAADEGGFATFGASRLVWEMYSGKALQMPAALPIIDAGIDFKHARGLSSRYMTGYEMERLQQRENGR